MDISDKENKFSHLLKPIRELADNWDINIASDLENYLEDLERLSINLGDGYQNLNFAEAALVIQGSALVYSKKVEYLYTLVYETLEMLSKDAKHAQEIKQRKQTNSDNVEDLFDNELPFLVLDCSQIEEGKGIDMTIDDIKKNQLNQISSSRRSSLLFRALPATLAMNQNERSFNLSSCAIAPSGAFVMNKSFRLPLQDTNSINQSFSLFSLQNTTNQNSRGDSINPLVSDQPNDIVTSIPPLDLNNDENNLGKDQNNNDSIVLNNDEPLPDENQPMNTSFNDDAPSDGLGVIFNEDLLATPQKSKPIPAVLPKKKKEFDYFAFLDPHEFVEKGNKPSKLGKTIIKPEDQQEKEDCSPFPWESSFPISQNVLFTEFTSIYMDIRSSFRHYKQSQNKQNKQSHPEGDENETGDIEPIAIQYDEEDQSEDEDMNIEPLGIEPVPMELPGFDDLEGIDMNMNINQNNNENENNHVISLSQSNGSQSFQTYEELCTYYISRFMQGIAQYSHETGLLKRVRMWEERIEPVLQTQLKYPPFDIKISGLSLINTIEEKEELYKNKVIQNKQEQINQMSFYQLNKNATDYEIRRNFVALLQLANDKNVEISSSKLEDGCDNIIVTLINNKIPSN
ncbi:hypothetical protein WA158_004428 [Blastocystis sp. Blastoise]